VGGGLGATDGPVIEAEFAHGFWFEEIAAIEEEGGVHAFFDGGEVLIEEFLPFGGEDEDLGTVDGFDGGGGEFDFSGVDELPFEGFIGALGVVSGNDGAFGDEAIDEFDGDGVADVIGIGFEGEAPDGDFFVFEDPESFAEFGDEAFEHVFVDAFDFFEEFEGGTELATDGDEGFDVFGEAGAAVAEAGVEEIATDAFIHADAIGDHFDIGAAGFADGGDGIDVANFEGEEGIGGVFDEFGAIDIGDKDGSFEGLVDLFHEIGGALAGRADDDPIWVHEIGNGGAFAKKLGITDHIEFGAFVVALDGFGDFFAGFDGDSGFIDDHAIVAWLEDAGDFAGDAFDVGEVDAAIGLGGSGNGDEDDLGVIDAVFDGVGEAEAIGGDVAVNEVFETGFVDGNFASLEGIDLALVVIDADDMVPNFCEASA